LRNVSFDTYSGESIGIIGANGAGKSTLLSMICGTISPTEGKIIRKGKISAILELGTGFHPQFTGRQNVELEAQINGITKSEFTEILTKIEDFADIGSYFDENVNTYSSGMLARLAFATATSTKPDVLIVDEALSVGDLAFQSKCMQRMKNLKKDGTCILLVSHSPNLIRQFCDRAIYISDGVVKFLGDVDVACDQYQNDLIGNDTSKSENIDIHELGKAFQGETNPNLRKNSLVDNDPGTYELEFIDFKIMDSKLNEIKSCRYGQNIVFKVVIFANKNVKEGTAVGLLIADRTGYHLASLNSNLYGKFLPALSRGQSLCLIWELEWPFQSGQFRFDIGLKPDIHTNNFYDRVFTAGVTETSPEPHLTSQNFGGYLYLNAKVSVSKPVNSK
jgi:lipopolysaccharide transport system ATP-binding protein